MTLLQRTMQLLTEAGLETVNEWVEELKQGCEDLTEDPNSETYFELTAHEVATNLCMAYDLEIELPDMQEEA